MNKNSIIVLFRQGVSQRKIAEQLGISRNTVAKYVDEYQELISKLNEDSSEENIKLIKEKISSKPKYDSSNRKKTKYNDEIDKRIDELLKFDEIKNKKLGPNKQGLTATGIHQILISEGFDIGLTVVTEHVKIKKDKLKEAYMKQHYEYGERCEFDFGEVKLEINGKVVEYHLGVFSAPKSNYIYAKLYRNQKMEAVLDCHVSFIKYCNGVYKEIVYDNMRNVVKRFIGRNEKELTDEILKLSTYYGFKINLTNTYSPHEKGHVENSVKQVVKIAFSKKYQFESYEEAQDHLCKEIAKSNENKLSDFNEEKTYLLKANPPYEIGVCRSHKVDSYSFIRLDNNYYSVPDYLVNKEVISKSYLDEIYIYSGDTFVYKHKKIDGYKEYSIDINHYLTSLTRKPGALKRSLAFKQAPEVIKSIYNNYFTTKPKDFIEVLKLSQDIGLDKVVEAINELEKESFINSINYQTIMQIVYKDDLKEMTENLYNMSLHKMMDDQEIIEENSKSQLKELSKIIELLN